MSSVLIFITIPNKDYEDEVREKEQLSIKLQKNGNLKKEILNANLEEDQRDACSLEKVVEDALSYLGILDATWQKSQGDKFFQILFPVDLQDSDIVIQHFKSLGIGRHLETSIGIIPFTLFSYNEDIDKYLINDDLLVDEKDISKSIGSFKEKQSKFLKSVTARLTVAQIVDSVRSSATVTFDFICYLIFGSWIAAMGLLDNSVISLVASMLVSPMMGPVMALAFGTIIKDRMLRNMGARNIGVCLMVTIFFGFFFGMIALNFTEHWNDWAWPTDMMRERGLIRVIWVGTLVAFPSGCAVAISLLSGNDASLVGVAISVSLLPPAVNTGLLWAFSLLRFLYSINQPLVETISRLDNSTIYLPESLIPDEKYVVIYNDNISIETFFLGCISLVLSLINITNILIGALLLLKIKEIAPLTTLSPESRRFFQEDIKIAREYNQSSKSKGNNLGEEFLKEWATIAGLDSDKFLKPEARAVQLQTLADIAKDVEADKTYQAVTKKIPNNDNLARRLSQSIFVPNTSNFSRDRTRSSLRSSSSFNLPSVVISDIETGASNRRPSIIVGNNYRNNCRRISTVALNNFYEKDDNASGGRISSDGYTNTAFTFNEADISNHNQERSRRRSSALLRITLQKSEHSRYSLWPSTRHSIVTSLDKPAINEQLTYHGPLKRPSIGRINNPDSYS